MSPLRKLAFTLVAVLGAMLLLEGGARVAIHLGLRLTLPPAVRDWIISQDIVFDPELGWRPSVGLGRVDGAHFEGSAAGVHQAKAPGELRGYAFGDSQTHGAGLAEGQAWPVAAEAALRRAGQPVRIINLGSSGYRSAQVLRLIEVAVLPLDPDFLIVDCQLHDSEPLVRRPPSPWDPARAALFHSRLYRLLWLGTAARRGQSLGPGGRGLDLPQGEVAQRGRPAGNHAAIAALAAAHGVPLLFVDYPFWERGIHALAPAEGLPPGVPVASTTPTLLAAGLPPEALFFENNHLTVEGSRIVGEAVAAALLPLLPPR